MPTLKARVRNGQLVVNEPTDLPEGTEVELMPIIGWSELDDQERNILEEALAAARDDLKPT